MKIVCTNNTLWELDTIKNRYILKREYNLTIGKTYDVRKQLDSNTNISFNSQLPISVIDDLGYPIWISQGFVTLDNWRETQLNKLNI